MTTFPRLASAAMAGALLLASCGSSDGGSSDVDTTGQRRQAIEKLRDFGLSKAQASCMAERLGPDAVVEVTDLAALADGQPYRDAAEECLRGS